ncbi:hypothetical protein [Nonomuraea sediminis]|uniref:hypothetical protein n=1 Tax=Nonomuraea sediminis TaxID=2835864 RepID=UPI001BDC7672|nr:hypothetical protein [Nonomuraea sediminis]
MTLQVPDVYQCTVRRLPDGQFKITHNQTGDVEIARDERDAQVKGILLRTAAAMGLEIPFTTGDLAS